MSPDIKTQLRHSLRSARRALHPEQQRHAAKAMARRIVRQRVFRQAQHIAFYWPSDGEISPRLLMHIAHRQNKQCYLPVIRQKTLFFARYQPHGLLRLNRYGIPEPQEHPARWRQPAQLDLIFMPLVGFDHQGNRLGMGGGFYDRSLARSKRQRHQRHQPLLIGLAHRCQEVARLPTEPWDIPLQGIATDHQFRLF